MNWKTQSLLAASFLVTLSSLAQLPTAADYDPKDPPQGLFADEWMEMYLGEQKVGWSHLTYVRAGDEIRTRMRSFMSIARGPITLEVESTETTVETVEGAPLSFGATTIMSNQPIKVSGKIEEGEVSLTTEGPGYSSTQSYPFPKGALMMWGLSREGFIRGVEPGTDYTLLAYVPSVSAQRPLPGRVEVLGEEEFLYRDKPMRGIKARTTLDAGAIKLETYSWMDREGRVYITETMMMGMPLRTVLVDEKTALADFIPAELFISNLIAVGTGIPADADSVRYRVSLREGSLPADSWQEWAGQRVLGEDGDSLIVEVSRIDPDTLQDEVVLPAGDHFAQYLRSNLMINSESPSVIKLAAKAAPDDASTLETANALRAFVHDYIDSKSLNIGFASAAEVAETPEGDCSEHAVLLAAMGRARGIPSRVVAGLIYLPWFEGHENIMGYHMWTQFYIGGQWIDYDATTEETVAAPTRLGLYASSLDEDSLAEIGLQLMDRMGLLQVEIAAIDVPEEVEL